MTQQKFLLFHDGRGSADPEHRIAIIAVNSEAEGETWRGLNKLGWSSCIWAFGLVWNEIRSHPPIKDGIYQPVHPSGRVQYLYYWHPNLGNNPSESEIKSQSTNIICTECKGSGQYVGLHCVEPCKTCQHMNLVG